MIDQETRDYAVEKECRAVYQNALYAILHNASPAESDEHAVRRATNIALASVVAFRAIRKAIQGKGQV